MKNVLLNKKLVRSIVLASSLLMSVFSVQADLVLSFDENDIEVGLNDIFSVDLYATPDAAVDSILSWGLDINFDNGILALNSFTLGADFMSTMSILTDTDGIGGAGLMGPVFAPNILLGSFEFTAVGYGSTSLSTSNTLGDLFEGFTTLNFFGSAFNSASANISVVSVSAPATLGLFVIALAGWISLRRKA